MFTINIVVTTAFEEAMSLCFKKVVRTEVFDHFPWAENINRIASVDGTGYRDRRKQWYVATQVVVDEASRCWRWSRWLERDIWLPGLWWDAEVTNYLRNLYMLGSGEYGRVSDGMLAEEADRLFEQGSTRSYKDEYGECPPLEI